MIKRFTYLFLAILVSINIATAVEPTIIIEEDFSFFIDGTEENPDAQSITNETFHVEREYTHLPNWIGYNVRQAGGACALLEFYHPDFGDLFGYISTPEMALYGECTITFKARRAHSNPGVGKLDLALCDNTSGRIETTYFELEDKWNEYTWHTDKAEFNDRCIFQFTPMEGGILLDDIVVERTRNKIPTVETLAPINNSISEFIAQWEPSALDSFEGYLLNVYYKDWPEEIIEPGSVNIDFESINLKEDGISIDTDNPGYPEGWDIDVSSNGSHDINTTSDNRNSGYNSINFDAVGDYILSPITPAPINEVSFWVRPSTMTQESYIFSLLGVFVKKSDGNWDCVAQIPNYWMSGEGGYYTLSQEVLGNYVDQIKLEMCSKNRVSFAIDDISLSYSTQTVPYPLITDQFVSKDETSYLVTNIDSSKEHYYNVRVKDGELVSAQSKDMWVDGITGISPTALPATDVTETSFTANWDAIPNADYYKLTINQEYETQSENESVELAYESFDQILDGTINNPYIIQSTTFNLYENGYSEQDWMLTNPQIVNGMAGSQGASGMAAGLVLSPKLTLNSNTIVVDVTAYNEVKGDVLWVLVIDEYNSTNARYAYTIDFSKTSTDYITGQVVFSGIDFGDQPLHIGFMTQKGAFYIDEVKITAIVEKPGTIVERPYKVFITDETSYEVSRIRKQAPSYNYNLTAHRNKNFLDYVSELSNTVRVQLYETNVEELSDDNKTIKIYSTEGALHVVMNEATQIDVYNLAGNKVSCINGKQGDNTIELSQGIYIVKANNKIFKTIIK